MAKSRTEKPASDELEELRTAVERLIQRIEALTDVVDRLQDELQWRNNEWQSHRDLSPPPILRSMPADATADDWQVNRVSAEQTASVREQLSVLRPAASLPLTAHDQFCRELAELRQIVAVLVLLTSDHDSDELSTAYDRVLEWASLEFDPDLLRESLPAEVVGAMTPTEPAPSPRQAVQSTLFSACEPDSTTEPS